MLFSSFSFLFVFLPVVVLLYFIIPNRSYRNLILLISSLVFYAWGEPKYVLLMIITIIVNYLLGLLIAKTKYRTLFFVIAIITNLSTLAYYKYINLIIDTINNLSSASIDHINVILPIGISFYMFQILSYIIDVYRKKVDVQKNPLHLATYICLFPQLIAGPIVRYSDIQNSLTNRKETINDVHLGLRRFIFGLAKKIIISNNVAIIANDIFTMPLEEINFPLAWLGAICFTIQIYFDFSGYSDMAIGLGRMFGFKFLENFNYPYIATSITDFWRRWHISLSSWFRDYIYFPLGGSRKSMINTIFNLFIVWSLTGLWHGASYNFVVWGLYFFVILTIEKFVLRKLLKKLPIINNIYTLLLIIIGWVIFNSSSFEQIQTFLTAMFKYESFTIDILVDHNYLYLIGHIIAGIILSMPIVKIIKDKLENKLFFSMIGDIISIALLVICVMYLVNDSYNPFIYFRF